MFDSDRIAVHTIAGLQRVLNNTLMHLYFVQPLTDEHLRTPLTDSPLHRRILLLVEVANGNLDHRQHEIADQADILDAWTGVWEAMQLVPPAHQYPEMLQVLQVVKAWLHADLLITRRQAAKLLRGQPDRAALDYIDLLVTSGQLKEYPNLKSDRAGRLSRNAILHLKAQTE